MDITFSGTFHIVVTLIFAAITLGIAVSFAVRPTDRKLRILKPMSWATLFSILAAIAAGAGATALNASLAYGSIDPKETAARITSGLAEAMVLPVFGFVLLSLCWLFVSVGMRRQE